MSSPDHPPYNAVPDSNAGPSTQLPLSNISRLMKSSLPDSPAVKVSSPTKTLMQDIVSEFIAFITCEAQERADAQKRSTLNGDDILYALEVLGFEEYEKVGKVWLTRYRIVSLANRTRHAGSSVRDY